VRTKGTNESQGAEQVARYQERMEKAREEREHKKKFTERGEVLPSQLQRRNNNADLEVEDEPEHSRREERSVTPSPQRSQKQEELGIVNLDHKLNDSPRKGSPLKDEQQPLLFVDVNLGVDAQERIVVFDGDTAEQLALDFCVKHDLDEDT